jgi:endonuclease/exonuclease/phosphatase family metal-dependent hydrolase
VRKDPVVVCGDFNYWGNGAVPSLVRRAIHDAALELGTPARTYPSRLPLLRLDRIYVDVTVKPLEVHPHRTPLAAVASDHLPLVMRFETPLVAAPPASAPVELIG